MKQTIGKKMYKVLYREVLVDVSKAMNSLSYDLVECPDSEDSVAMYDELTNAIKKEICAYIDSQQQFFKKTRSGL